MGESSLLSFNQNQDSKTLPSGPVTINRIRVQQLDNGYKRFTMVYALPQKMHISIFNPPEGDRFMLLADSAEAGESGELIFDLKDDDLKAIERVTINFYNEGGDSSFISFNTSQLKFN